MFTGTVLCVQRSDAITYAKEHLQQLGIPVTSKCEPDVTHVLLPVPSFPTGDEYLAHILTKLPDGIIISGGNLKSPLLEHCTTVDFLTDPFYLAENAAITAECAAQLAQINLGDLSGLPILILGWGRIGKCLSQELRSQGYDVTIAARKNTDLAILNALGYKCVPISQVGDSLFRYRLIFNTVPELILPNAHTHPNCLILELASKPGITGGNIHIARGLPGKMAPQRSGELIARTFMRLSI